jgi:hypothetical protein
MPSLKSFKLTIEYIASKSPFDSCLYLNFFLVHVLFKRCRVRNLLKLFYESVCMFQFGRLI